MLRDNFYTIDALQDMSVSLHTHASHPIYHGHFPQRPITPGACLVQIVEEVLSLLLHSPLQTVAIKQVKFTAVHTPDKPLTILFAPQTPMEYSIIIRDSDTIYAKMQATYLCTDSDI